MSGEESEHPQPAPPNWLALAWDDYVDNLPRLVPVLLFPVLLSFVTFYIIDRWHSYVPALAYMAGVLTPLSLGVNLSFIRAVRREPGVIPAMFSAVPVYGRALAVSFGLGAMTLAGTFLFIVPGAVLYSTYCFSEYVVVERRTGVGESFAFSSAITAGWRIPIFMLVLLLVIGELVVPNPVYVSGSLAAPAVKTDLRPWVLAAFLLKTFFYFPWVKLALARAYVFLSSGSVAAPGPK